MHTVSILEEGWLSIWGGHGSSAEGIADTMGMDRDYVSRVLSGDAAPDAAFIGNALMSFPMSFSGLFAVTLSGAPVPRLVPR
jgi:transcriptional regulator with XRE-family HTH domain